MAKRTDKLEQLIAQILAGQKTTNLQIAYVWYGTSTALENEAHNDLTSPIAGTRRAGSQQRVLNQYIISDFINGNDAVSLFGNGTIITEYGAFFQPQATGEMAARHADTRADDYTANANVDLSFDITMTIGE